MMHAMTVSAALHLGLLAAIALVVLDLVAHLPMAVQIIGKILSSQYLIRHAIININGPTPCSYFDLTD